MKTMATKILLSAVAATALFTGCGEDDAAACAPAIQTDKITCTTIASKSYKISSATTKAFTEVCSIKGQFLHDVYLSNDKLWELDGQVRIGGDNKFNSTVRIEAGTVIYGEEADFLLITRGSKIMAEGNNTHPIVFTAKGDIFDTAFNRATAEGKWGGVAIAGKAQVNKATEVAFEFSDTGDKFGGNDDTDNSGIMKYVVVKYSGYEVRPDEEVQGISLGAVGSKTTLEYISIHNSSDDGIEMWGGTVNVKYLSVTGADDDSIDTDNGYRGNLQYVYVEQQAGDGKGDKLLEADNDGSNYSNAPVSHPKISNFTFISNGNTNGFNWREGTRYSLANGTISSKLDQNKSVIKIPDDASFTVFSGDNNASKFSGVEFMGANISKFVSMDANQTVANVENYMIANAANSDITGDKTGAQTVTALTAVGTFMGNTLFYDDVNRTDFKLANGTDWRTGWAVDINGTIIE